METGNVELWLAAVRANPEAYRLPAYGPWLTAEQTARYFAAWAAAQAAGDPASALCRRCGRLLRPERPAQQLHAWCEPPLPPTLLHRNSVAP